MKRVSLWALKRGFLWEQGRVLLDAFLGHGVDLLCLWKSVEYLNSNVSDYVAKFRNCLLRTSLLLGRPRLVCNPGLDFLETLFLPTTASNLSPGLLWRFLLFTIVRTVHSCGAFRSCAENMGFPHVTSNTGKGLCLSSNSSRSNWCIKRNERGGWRGSRGL